MTETLKLSRPLAIGREDCKEVTELSYDFDAMQASDLLTASKYMNAAGLAHATVPEFDTTYHLYLFAKAVEIANGGRISVYDVLRIPAKDASRASGLARDFFYIST